MKNRVIVIFCLVYASLLAALMTASIFVSEITGWDPSAEGIGNLMSIIAFGIAVLLSTSRPLHVMLGDSSASLHFQKRLKSRRWSLVVGIVISTTAINLASDGLFSWQATGEVMVPSLLRIVVLSVVYCIAGRVIIGESVERMRYA